jgi:hypothetical protein
MPNTIQIRPSDSDRATDTYIVANSDMNLGPSTPRFLV